MPAVVPPGNKPPTLTNGDVAGIYLRAIGAPDTAVMRRFVLAWMKAEGGTGNNPMNIAGFDGPCGTRVTKFHKFPIFCTPQQGAKAWSDRLSSPNHGYPAIRKAIISGDPAASLTAVINSGWVTGDTGLKQYQYTVKGKHYNSLVNAYNSLGAADIAYYSLPVTGGGYGTTPAGPSLQGAPAPQIPSLIVFMAKYVADNHIDPNHTITSADLLAYTTWYHSQINPDTGRPIPGNPQDSAASLGQFVGKTWAEAIAAKSISWPNNDPISNLTNALAVPIQILQTVVDPKNWIKILALFAGGGLLLVGGWITIKDLSASEEGPAALPQPPIIIRGIR